MSGYEEAKKRRLAVLLCVGMLLALCIPAVQAADDDVDNAEIQWMETAVTLTEDETLVGVWLAEVPEKGALTLNGRRCLAGEGIAAEDLTALRYQPVSTEVQSCRYYPVYEDGTLGDAETAELTARCNHNPVAESARYETYRNMTVAGCLDGIDPDGEALTAAIAEEPTMGTVTVIPETGSFLYTPYQNRIGTDHFSFCLTDESGAVSAAAEVTVRVARPQSELTYEDMQADPAQYAAVRLAELGIWQGAQVGGVAYFEPEKTVTRGEFIAMAVALAEEEILPTADTGMADNEEIPVWARPFAAAALQSGLVSGSIRDGVRVLRAGDAISRAEAAVILCAAAQISEAATVQTLADSDTVPAWAKASVTSVCELGILSCAGNSFNPDGTLTRAEAAQALYAAYCQREKSIVKTGLFSWIA